MSVNNFVYNNASLPGTKADAEPLTVPANEACTAEEFNVLTGALSDIRTQILSSWNILAYGADPTGAADCTTAFTNALAAISAATGSAPAVLHLPPGTYFLNSTTVSIPSNVALRFDGAVIELGSGVQIVIASAIDAANVQIFASNSGNTTPVSFTGPIKDVSPIWFGADPSGTNDSSNAFKWAVNSLNNPAASGSLLNGGSGVAVPAGNFKLTSYTVPPTGVRPRKVYGTKASGPPSSGMWGVNDTYDFTDAGAGDAQGYWCITGGSPGTWKLYGAISL